jgi:carbonic anhydrase
VRKIILLGHTRCGAVKALVDKIDDPEISDFIDVAQTALAKAKAQGGPSRITMNYCTRWKSSS